MKSLYTLTINYKRLILCKAHGKKSLRFQAIGTFNKLLLYWLSYFTKTSCCFSAAQDCVKLGILQMNQETKDFGKLISWTVILCC